MEHTPSCKVACGKCLACRMKRRNTPYEEEEDFLFHIRSFFALEVDNFIV